MSKKIVIVGGGLTGCSVAYHLARGGAAADVVVIEPDPTYEFAATPRAVGGVRAMFGVRENVEMSLFAFDVFDDLSAYLDLPPNTVDAGFRQQGYMYLASGAPALESLEDLRAMQHAAGAEVEILDRTELERRWPSINFNDVDAANYSYRDGAADPNAILQGFRRAAISKGVEIIEDRVTGFEISSDQVRAVRLASGETIPCHLVINATNYWAPEVCKMVGMEVPIRPLVRQTFYFDCQAKIETIAVMRDASGFVIRPEGKGYLTGRTDKSQIGKISFDVDYDLFDEELWPRLAERCHAFEAIKVQSGWAGIYDMNTFDGNPIVGPWASGLDNFYLVAGFSGHGMQQGPAIGRGVAEHILSGRFETIDLSIFSHDRIIRNRPIVDIGPNA